MRIQNLFNIVSILIHSFVRGCFSSEKKVETREFGKQGHSLFLFYYGMFRGHPRSCNNDRLETSHSLSKPLFPYAFTRYSAQRATPSRSACNTNGSDMNFGTWVAGPRGPGMMEMKQVLQGFRRRAFTWNANTKM